LAIKDLLIATLRECNDPTIDIFTGAMKVWVRVHVNFKFLFKLRHKDGLSIIHKCVLYWSFTVIAFADSNNFNTQGLINNEPCAEDELLWRTSNLSTGCEKLKYRNMSEV